MRLKNQKLPDFEFIYKKLAKYTFIVIALHFF